MPVSQRAAKNIIAVFMPRKCTAEQNVDNGKGFVQFKAVYLRMRKPCPLQQRIKRKYCAFGAYQWVAARSRAVPHFGLHRKVMRFGIAFACQQHKRRAVISQAGIGSIGKSAAFQHAGQPVQKALAHFGAYAFIAHNPRILLADEPTGALDSNSSRMLLTMLTELNKRLSATILMVTHDAFSASYCHRILFIKDGQVFNELHRGTDTRKEFFTKILEVVSVLGGEQSEHM